MSDDCVALGSALGAQGYIASEELTTVLFLAQELQRPLLVEGPAGVGKTALAGAWAAASGRRLIRLQCYEGLDESRALYEWEYARQMLYTQLLRDKLGEMLAAASSLAEAADQLADQEEVFFSERFLLARPLLQAITSDEPALLLIDEIDRADSEFEAFLLEVLSEFQVSVPELGTIRARHHPAVVLTSNHTRELSEALRRRCLYIFIDYPTQEAELEILRLHVPQLNERLAARAVALVQGLRELDLRKNPGISETIDWARALVALHAETLDRRTLERTLSVLLKHEQDLQRARRRLSRPANGSTARGEPGPHSD